MSKKYKNYSNDDIRAWHSCGCCIVEMEFKSPKDVKKEFERVGIGRSRNVIDENGTVHIDVNTDKFWRVTYDGKCIPYDMTDPDEDFGYKYGKY